VFYTSSFVHIDQLAVIGMTMPGGETYEWFRRNVEIPAYTLAVTTTPTRTGRMRALNYPNMGANQYGLWVGLGNAAPYADYVHDGTDGPIFATGFHYNPGVGYSQRKMLTLGVQSPTGWGYPPFMWAKSVSGQRAQPWLAESISAALQAQGFYATTERVQGWR